MRLCQSVIFIHSCYVLKLLNAFLDRFYVHSSVYDKFAQIMTEKVKALKVGDGFDDGVNIGPLIHGAAVKKVQAHLDDALSHGGKVTTGGKHLGVSILQKRLHIYMSDHSLTQGNFFEPTVLTGMTNDCAIATEETFGPLAALFPFETEEEVIKLANNVDVGLAGYFFSRDIGRVWRMAEQLEVGMVCANTGMISQTSIPFGGVKDSGFGREGSQL